MHRKHTRVPKQRPRTRGARGGPSAAICTYDLAHGHTQRRVVADAPNRGAQVGAICAAVMRSVTPKSSKMVLHGEYQWH